MNLFEEASKSKYRYPYSKGLVNTEDLWDLSIDNLNSVYKSLSAQKKSADETSLLTKPSSEDAVIINKMEIVKYIFEKKQERVEELKAQKAAADKKKRIAELIAAKEDQKLADLDIEELKKIYSEL